MAVSILLLLQVETYLDEVYKTAGLQDLMDQEVKMVREIKALDSDMQTLVYENYNKFISATDTIRKMKDDFRQMEDEMESLAENMQAITDFSDTINATLADKRHRIKKLNGVHGMLKKLQFLFELPARLNKCMEMGSYAQAVRYGRNIALTADVKILRGSFSWFACQRLFVGQTVFACQSLV